MNNYSYILFNADNAVQALSEVVASLLEEGVSLVEGEERIAWEALGCAQREEVSVAYYAEAMPGVVMVDEILDTLEAFGVTWEETTATLCY